MLRQHPPIHIPSPCTKNSLIRVLTLLGETPTPITGLCWAWIPSVTPKHPPPPQCSSTSSASAGVNRAGRMSPSGLHLGDSLGPGARCSSPPPLPREPGLSITSTPGVSEPPREGGLGEGPCGLGWLVPRAPAAAAGKGHLTRRSRNRAERCSGRVVGGKGGSGLSAASQLPTGRGVGLS